MDFGGADTLFGNGTPGLTVVCPPLPWYADVRGDIDKNGTLSESELALQKDKVKDILTVFMEEVPPCPTRRYRVLGYGGSLVLVGHHATIV